MNPLDRRPAADAARPLPSASPRPCTVEYQDAVPRALDASVLACVVHGAAAPAAPRGNTDPRHIFVDLPLLGGPAVELWRSATPVQSGWDGDIGYACNGALLIGQLRLATAGLGDFEPVAFGAYQALEQFLQRQGYPAWLRVWNYIPQIHLGSGDQERYRRFVEGRHRAWSAKPDFEAALPAATAIGTQGDELLIYFLAAREPGIPVENPRQVSAYRYPRQYGARSPSFSRAMLANWSPRAELLVSGTASVVGHETLHAGDPQRQLDESLANLDAVRAGASRLGAADANGWEPQVIKLYVRRAEDAAPARARLAPLVSPQRLVVMQGDICRSDLSLELEASYRASAAAIPL